MAIKQATMMTTNAERVRSPASSPAVKLARPTAITWIQGVGECVLVRRAADDTMTTIGSGQNRRAAKRQDDEDDRRADLRWTVGHPRSAGRRG